MSSHILFAVTAITGQFQPSDVYQYPTAMTIGKRIALSGRPATSSSRITSLPGGVKRFTRDHLVEEQQDGGKASVYHSFVMDISGRPLTSVPVSLHASGEV